MFFFSISCRIASISSSLAFSICRARSASWPALPAKNLSLKLAEESALGVGLRDGGAVEVRAFTLVAFDEALFLP